MTMQTTFKGRDYYKSVDRALHNAQNEYRYPTSNTSQGMGRTMGRDWYGYLLKEEISRAKIPNGLKARLIKVV